MPFCRKCGRRLVEYSESCPDCGTSTTAPLINIKRSQSNRATQMGRETKPAKAFIPEASSIQIKTVTAKPTQTPAPAKKVSPPQTASAKAVAQTYTFVKATPPKLVEQPKPVLSAKHIIKPKKAKQTKPAAAFSFTNARPIAGLEIPQIRLAPKPQPKPVAAAKTVTQPTPSPEPPQPQPAPVEEPKPVVAAVVAPAPPPARKPKTSVVPAEPLAPPKPVAPAPVYPPHEIIKSNVSLKEDILANPQDYETQTFDFDLECPQEHFWPEGKALPVSNGKAYCPLCGERLSKPKPKKKRRRRYRRL